MLVRVARSLAEDADKWQRSSSWKLFLLFDGGKNATGDVKELKDLPGDGLTKGTWPPLERPLRQKRSSRNALASLSQCSLP